MKTSICIEITFTEVPFEERFGKIKDAGFDYFEFSTWEDKDLDMIKKNCEKHDLKVAAFSGDKWLSPIDPCTNGEYIAFTKKSVDAAVFLGCENLVVHSNALSRENQVINAYDDLDDKFKFANMVLVYNQIKGYAEEKGVTLNLEALNTRVEHPGNFLTTSEDSANIVKLVDSPRFRFLFDVYHLQIMEGNVIDNLTKHFPRIGYIHIADVPGRHEPGTGELNYKNIIKVLKSLGYRGFIGCEFFPREDSRRALDALKHIF